MRNIYSGIIIFIFCIVFILSDGSNAKEKYKSLDNVKIEKLNKELIEKYFYDNIISKLNPSVKSSDILQSSSACGSKFDRYILESVVFFKEKKTSYIYKVKCAGYIKCDRKWIVEEYIVMISRSDRKINILKFPE